MSRRRNKNETFEFEFEDVQLTPEITCDITVEFEASYEDEGIGPYEFWGSREVHVDMQWSVQELTVVKLQGWDNDNVEYFWEYGIEPTPKMAELITAAEANTNNQHQLLVEHCEKKS